MQHAPSAAAMRERPYGPTDSVHLAVERHAAIAPDEVAVQHRDWRLTYGELDRRANRLARHLVARGAAPEQRVVVCVEPSVDIVVALLAILKAGAVYVPVDPGYPAARIQAILEDTAPVLVLTQAHLEGRLGLGDQAALSLDTVGPQIEYLSGEPLAAAIDVGQTASVYYTSGTTGTPKGVMASHGNLAAYLGVAKDRFGVLPGDVIPAIARFSFSISMFELMLPLVSGAKLLILDRDHVLDPGRMVHTLREVTFFHAGPSLLRGLLASIRTRGLDPGAYGKVRHASSGGDMVPPELLENLKEIFRNAEVFVIYGCSEISCMGCNYAVPRDRAITRTYVGRPFDDVCVSVLDGAQCQVPAGVVGEIHFAGPGVTTGYLNRPELTAEKFVTVEGRRFYRTGDLGRFTEDGCLEILGRTDFQVKVRGMRVELAEVELRLRSAPGVHDGVVAAHGAEGVDKSLCAYYVPAEGQSTSAVAIRRHLADWLPDYMVPTIYVELASLPLNHNMKVDRRSLPAPTEADRRRSAGRSVRPPETPTEKTLAALWAKHLRVETVGLDDNFFELGGDSLLAMELAVDVSGSLHFELDGMTLLRESLHVQAAIIDRRGDDRGPPCSVRAPLPARAEELALFHFGPGQSLHGALTTPQSGPARRAILICGPIGQECARTDFVLQRLALGLAEQGVAALRFDWYGCRDSLGDSVDASPTRWASDIREAALELRRRTGAARVSAVGVRLGATLLANAAHALELCSLVLWDAVTSGARYVAEQRALHQSYVRELRHLRGWRPVRRIPGAEELVGTTFSLSAIRDLQAMTLPETRPQARLFSSIGQVDCQWNDLARLEDLLPDGGITRALMALVLEGM